MLTTDVVTATVDAMFEEAGAKVCASCGKRSAVRTDAVQAERHQSTHTVLSAPISDTGRWFCFECGHEE